MNLKSKIALVLAAALLIQWRAALVAAEDTVQIKKWKVDDVDLYDQPDGQVVETRRAAQLEATQAVRMEKGWLKILAKDEGGKEHAYFVEASQARTDLKLSGLPKCDKLNAATGFAASRGLGEKGCEP